MTKKAKQHFFLFTGLMIWMTSFTASAGMDCFRDCMDASGCWSARSDENVSYCSGTEARCETECRHAAKDKSYGAIAYSAKDGAYGFSDSWKDQKNAEKAALKYCKQHGSKCKVAVWFYTSCGAVAADGRKVGWGQGSSEAGARKKALSDCKGFFNKHCEVKTSHCSW